MKIDELEPQKPTRFLEGMLFEAIEEYIDKSNFPKDLVLKKLDLLERTLKKSIEDVEILSSKGTAAIEDLMKKTQKLDNQCNNLLYKLRKIFSN